ncbi:MAG: response regulator transcription factor, partial [Pedobacter sp.]
MIYIALADDHVLLRQGLAQLINTFTDHKVLFEADNGKDLIQKLKPYALPEIILMDITMPEMDGYETTSWLKVNYPQIRVIALSMIDDEAAVVRMLKCG